MADDFQSYKVAANEQSSSTKFNNLVQAIEDALNSLDNSNIATAAAIAVAKLAAGSNGDFLQTTAGVPVWGPGPNAVGYSTSLPGSPTNGQEHILVDSTSSPTYAWRFRYNSAKSSNKWDYIGGAPIFARRTSTDAQTANSTWEALNSPTITVPVAGNYEVRLYAAASCSAAVYTISAGIKQGSGNGTPSSNASAGQSHMAASVGQEDIECFFDPTTDATTLGSVAASTVIQMVLHQNTATTTTWGVRRMSLLPIAVGG